MNLKYQKEYPTQPHLDIYTLDDKFILGVNK